MEWVHPKIATRQFEQACNPHCTITSESTCQNRDAPYEVFTVYNAKGQGRPPKLIMAQQVCLCLFYMRYLSRFKVLYRQFGVSKTEANDTFHDWLGVLRELLPASLLGQLEHQSI